MKKSNSKSSHNCFASSVETILLFSKSILLPTKNTLTSGLAFAFKSFSQESIALKLFLL